MKSFDSKHFWFIVKENGLKDLFQPLLSGFADGFLIFKVLFTERSSDSKENLYRDFVGREYNAHDSLENVMALRRVLSEKNTSWDDLSKFN